MAAITAHHENRDDAVAAGYTINLTAPTTAAEGDLLTITFYDDYTFQKPAGFDFGSGYGTANTTVKGQVTGGRTRMLPGAPQPGGGTTGSWLTNVAYYDAEYRVIQTVRELYDLGSGANERLSTKYKYDLAPVVSEQKTVQTVGCVTHTHLAENSYDHADRLLAVKETVTANGNTKTAHTLAQRYNTLGQLQSKWFHGYAADESKYRRRTTYTNNILGWLTDAKTSYQIIQGTDLPFYAFSLSYNNALYGPQYSNGNISKMEWSGKDQSAFSGGLTFTYDKANRLLSSVKPSTATYTYGDTESGITYDANGNIKTLVRAGAAVDNLSYTYVGNRLSALSDASGNNTGVKNGASAYTYDLNGNMLTDGNRGAVLTYNYLNLPKTVTVGGKSFQYDYDAGGNKHKYAGDTVNIKYAGRFEYGPGNVLKRVSTSEGQLVPSGDTLRFDYFLKDHLGNVRVVWNEKGDIIQRNDYYPFGLSIDRNDPIQPQNARNDVNGLLYNSKELQVGTGFVDYGARMYMPEIGRWGVVDPMADHRNWLTPYNYGQNNPVNVIDPDGAFDDYLIRKDGDITVKKTDDSSDRFYTESSSRTDDGIVIRTYKLEATLEKNEDGLVALPETFNGNGYGFQYTGSENENYVSGPAFAGLLGALKETQFSDVSLNHWSNSDGSSPSPSRSHKDGEVGDIRPLRKDKSGEPVLTTDKQFDAERNTTMIGALKKFGWTSVLSEKNPSTGKITPGTTHYSGYTDKNGNWNPVRHNNHFHIQKFHPNLIQHKPFKR